jgi:hypothetical protein
MRNKIAEKRKKRQSKEINKIKKKTRVSLLEKLKEH